MNHASTFLPPYSGNVHYIGVALYQHIAVSHLHPPLRLVLLVEGGLGVLPPQKTATSSLWPQFSTPTPLWEPELRLGAVLLQSTSSSKISWNMTCINNNNNNNMVRLTQKETSHILGIPLPRPAIATPSCSHTIETTLLHPGHARFGMVCASKAPAYYTLHHVPTSWNSMHNASKLM